MSRRQYQDKDAPAPTPLELLRLLWRVVWPLAVRLLWIVGLVLIAAIVMAVAEHGCASEGQRGRRPLWA